MITELMNEAQDPQDAILTITYEYIPYMPPDFSTASSLWLDVGDCHSDVPVPNYTKSFELTMQPWTSTVSGRILTAISHIHDGGVRLDVLRNGYSVCRSVATYGDPSGHKHHMLSMEMSHISYMSTCYDVGRIKEGEEWAVKAHYDFEKHEPMLDGDGKPEDVMGITIVYLVED